MPHSKELLRKAFSDVAAATAATGGRSSGYHYRVMPRTLDYSDDVDKRSCLGPDMNPSSVDGLQTIRDVGAKQRERKS
ncbi:hypothetical protein HZH66_012036 [Vespula vulgaris]|uniref:Uncharacterized protein n=1 Tax=Vespula vulgaris TaxID=7454 RepID=A0A834MUI5_VESVU|nr:hypothetical protein HZH66_012036 [Vespula vulgaris]